MSARGPMTTRLRIVRGEPSAEELAALTAVVATAGRGGSGPEPSPRGGWGDPTHGFAARQRYWPVGPGGWRAAALW